MIFAQLNVNVDDPSFGCWERIDEFVLEHVNSVTRDDGEPRYTTNFASIDENGKISISINKASPEEMSVLAKILKINQINSVNPNGWFREPDWIKIQKGKKTIMYNIHTKEKFVKVQVVRKPKTQVVRKPKTEYMGE